MQWPSEKLTLDGVLGYPFWLVSLGLFCGIVAILRMIEKRYPWKDEINGL